MDEEQFDEQTVFAKVKAEYRRLLTKKGIDIPDPITNYNALMLYQGTKRLFDIIVSALALLLFSPIMGLTALVIILADGRPVFFAQERLGQSGRVFLFYKFRSMTNNPNRQVNIQVREEHPEVTAVGHFIRRTKIDELPQLWNVLKNDLSIVGPRPALPDHLAEYTSRQRQRLEVKGGLTCLAQINGSSYLSWDERIEYDLEYLTKRTFWYDLWLILLTLRVIILGEKRFVKHPVVQETTFSKPN